MIFTYLYTPFIIQTTEVEKMQIIFPRFNRLMGVREQNGRGGGMKLYLSVCQLILLDSEKIQSLYQCCLSKAKRDITTFNHSLCINPSQRVWVLTI